MSNDIKMKCLWNENKECREGDCKYFEILPMGRTWMRVCNFQMKKEKEEE